MIVQVCVCVFVGGGGGGGGGGGVNPFFFLVHTFVKKTCNFLDIFQVTSA